MSAEATRQRWADPEYRERLTGENHPMYGKTSSEETKAKLRAAWTPERKAKMSAANTGKNHPMYGKPRSKETKAKISAALTGENNPMYGKTLTEEHKAKLSAASTGKTHTEEARAKISAALMKRWEDPEYKAKMSVFLTGKTHTEEARAKMSAARTGENHPMYGKTLTEEHKAKLSAALTGENNPFFGKTHTEEARAKMSAALIGKNAPNWKGGISFEPYCPMFNNKIKEEVRNKWNRSCAHCGKSEILNGARLCVHHIDSDKMAGCDGKKWNLIALCRFCHGKLHNHERFECLVLMNLEVR